MARGSNEFAITAEVFMNHAGEPVGFSFVEYAVASCGGVIL